MIRLILLTLACTTATAFADEVRLNCPAGQSTQMVEYRGGHIPICIADGWDPIEFIFEQGLAAAKAHKPACPIGLRVGEVGIDSGHYTLSCVQDVDVEILP